MARRYILVSYDIADDGRRNRVCKTLRDYGERVQYSVFCCEVNERELLRLKELLKDRVAAAEDRVLFVDAGEVGGQHPTPEIAYIGVAWQPEERSQVV